MDEPRRGWMESLLRPALTNVVEQVRQAALRTITAVASAIALGLLLAIVAVVTVVVGVLHLAAGVHGLVRMLVGETWAAELLSGALLLAVPMTCAVILAYRRPAKPPSP